MEEAVHLGYNYESDMLGYLLFLDTTLRFVVRFSLKRGLLTMYVMCA